MPRSRATHRFLLALLLPGCLLLAISAPVRGSDAYRVTLDPEAREAPATGRLILFFVTKTERRWGRMPPAMGPFWDAPQPIASIAVSDLPPGGSVTLDGSAVAWPHSVDLLDGPMRVQAVLDTDETQRSHLQGPGNVISEPMAIDVAADRDDVIELTLTRRIEAPRPADPPPNVRWIELRSDILSDFYGRDMFHRAGVALPKDYDNVDASRRQWPTIYVVPGFGGRYVDAINYGEMLTTRNVEEVAPIAVYVVLDPECGLGHHGFADSANNGPRETALVKELIPHLEKEFRLVTRPEARIVTGHSSGGWSSIWLQLKQPDVFGACWASAPDPIDFTAFQACNLYDDENLYTDEQGNPRPSYRVFVSAAGDMEVAMTVREECLMEHAMHPLGGSGQQWDTWEAMFSPRDPETGYPRPMFDPSSGLIDVEVVKEHWSDYDITKLVRENWDRLGPVVLERVRLSCGELDSFYLDRAVRRFGDAVEALASAEGKSWNGGYVNMVPDADHSLPELFNRTNREMREYLRRHGLMD